MLIESIIGVVGGILDKIIPDEKAREQAKLALLQAENQQALEEAKIKMSAILAEAGSADPWTSRARPSFLYVVYVFLLMAIPMGILFAFSPQTAIMISDGVRGWLNALPKDIIELFQWVMLGYIGGRSLEKIKGVTK